MEQCTKLMKTCDQCKLRKVRCTGAGHRGATSCINCARRNVTCHFSPLQKPRRRRRIGQAAATPGDLSSASAESPHQDDGTSLEMTQYDGLQELYVDRLLANPRPESPQNAQNVSLQGLGIFGAEYSLTFFSEPRLASLAQKLGHDRVTRSVGQVASIIAERMKLIERMPAPAADVDRSRVLGADAAFISTCIQAYFEYVHPNYPFLDRQQIESIALSPHLQEKLATDKAWSALFYSILALGSQYRDGGSYQPAKNIAWAFFSTALALFPDLLISKTNLVIVQSIAVMAIFASNVSCMQLEYVMVSEGARKAQQMGFNRLSARGDDPRNRVFWVLYCLEKMMAFALAKSSTIMDTDICSAVPLASSSELLLGEFDPFLSFVRLARLQSRIYGSLYSVSVRGRQPEYYKATISCLKNELEAWRETIPPPLQPGSLIRPYGIQTPQLMDICIRLRYAHLITTLHLQRASLHLEDSNSGSSEAMEDVMHTARTVLELTKHIDIEPYTPLWVIAGVPLAAFLVLFDLVIEHPAYAETRTNLALLDVGAGYFSRLEYASGGTLPGSISSEFSHIARDYVRDISRPDGENTNIVRPTSSGFLTTNPTMSEINPQTQEESGPQPQLATLGNDNTDSLPSDWGFQSVAGDMITGTDILDLFGSYIPNWEEDWNFGIVDSTPSIT